MYSLTPSVLNRFANTLAALCVHWWWMSLQLLFNFSQKLLCLWQKVSLSIPPFHPLKSMPSFAKVTHNLFSFEDWATMPGPPMQGRFIFKSDALSYTISHCDDWRQVGTDVLMSNKILDFALFVHQFFQKIKNDCKTKTDGMKDSQKGTPKYFNYFSWNFHISTNLSKRVSVAFGQK